MFEKYSYVSQIDMRDCGVAALSSIIQHHGSYYSLAHLRELAKTGKEGTSALGIIEAANKLNFDTQAIKADMRLFEMEDVPYPFIVHVNKEQRLLHYYVVYGVKKDKIIIGDPDPSVKITKLSKERFASEWTGAAILIAPEETYKTYKEQKKGLLSFIPQLLNYKSLISLILLFSIMVTSFSIVGSYYLQEVLDFYIPKQMYSQLGIISIGLIVSYIIQQIFSFFKNFLLEKLSLQLTIDLFLDYLRHIFDLPLDFFATRRTGEIISRFNDATTIIDALASALFSLFLDVTVLLFVGGTMLVQNKALFYLTISAIPVYSLIILAFVPIFEKLNTEVMHENAMINSALIEDINGIETIKALTSEQTRFKQIGKDFSRQAHKTLKLSRFEALQQVLKQSTQLILNIGILWLGANLVMTQKLSIGQLITYNTLLIYFINPLENIISLQTKLQAARVANTRLNEVYLVQSEHSKSDQEKVNLHGEIKVQQVHYQYGFTPDILKNINLSIKPGEKVALVGASGSGKTTLAKMLVNFFAPSSGQIFLNEHDISNLNKTQLRKHINYLPQQAYIFNGSILDNLTLGLDNISEELLFSACQTAEILSDIQEMPLGFKTELADGSGLSGGQKQRLALARALLTEAPVLILDEATSSLDVLTEKRIIDNLLSLSDKTIIFIAHRLSIAEKSDTIFVMKNGQIIEQGTHKNLIKKSGYYHHLFTT